MLRRLLSKSVVPLAFGCSGNLKPSWGTGLSAGTLHDISTTMLTVSPTFTLLLLSSVKILTGGGGPAVLPALAPVAVSPGSGGGASFAWPKTKQGAIHIKRQTTKQMYLKGFMACFSISFLFRVQSRTIALQALWSDFAGPFSCKLGKILKTHWFFVKQHPFGARESYDNFNTARFQFCGFHKDFWKRRCLPLDCPSTPDSNCNCAFWKINTGHAYPKAPLIRQIQPRNLTKPWVNFWHAPKPRFWPSGEKEKLGPNATTLRRNDYFCSRWP